MPPRINITVAALPDTLATLPSRRLSSTKMPDCGIMRVALWGITLVLCMAAVLTWDARLKYFSRITGEGEASSSSSSSSSSSAPFFWEIDAEGDGDGGRATNWGGNAVAVAAGAAGRYDAGDGGREAGSTAIVAAADFAGGWQRTHGELGLAQELDNERLRGRRLAVPPQFDQQAAARARVPSKEQRVESAILYNFNAPVEQYIDLDDVKPGHLWVPISIDKFDANSGGMVKVKMCQLNYDDYAAKPWLIPMGGLLNQHSGCADVTSSSVKLLTVSALENALARDTIAPVPPTGFVYHETRCGSTLAANMLASVTSNLVWSESTGPWKVMHSCKTCPKEQLVRYLRLVMSLMGRSRRHSRLFFKFQSSDDIEHYSAAFPNTPWIFLFREPVEVMMSRLGAQRIGMEGMQGNVEGQMRAMNRMRSKPGSRENVVAGTLASLCTKAIDEAERSPGNGMMVEYTHLPNVLLDVVLPKHFHVELTQTEREQLTIPAKLYSKVAHYQTAEIDNPTFTDDKVIKHSKADEVVVRIAEDQLGGLYNKLKGMQTWLR